MQLFTSASSIHGVAAYFLLSLFVSFVVLVFVQILFSKTTLKSHNNIGASSSKFIVFLVLTMSFLGATVGITGGWSREGVVGELIPAMLGVVGGLSVYLYGKHKSKALVVLPSVIAFTVTIYLGYFIGAEIRNPIDRATAYRDMCFSVFSNAEILSSKEAYCRFLAGAGDDCFFEMFKNKMTYSSTSRYGDENYRKSWEIVNKNRIEHQILQCQIISMKQKKALVEAFN